MGQLHFTMNGRYYARNFKYIVFQDEDGLMTEPILCSLDITLGTGIKEEANERILMFTLKPGSIRKWNPTDLYPAKMDPFFAYLFGGASMFAFMVLLAFIG